MTLLLLSAGAQAVAAVRIADFSVQQRSLGAGRGTVPGQHPTAARLVRRHGRGCVVASAHSGQDKVLALLRIPKYLLSPATFAALAEAMLRTLFGADIVRSRHALRDAGESFVNHNTTLRHLQAPGMGVHVTKLSVTVQCADLLGSLGYLRVSRQMRRKRPSSGLTDIWR